MRFGDSKKMAIVDMGIGRVLFRVKDGKLQYKIKTLFDETIWRVRIKGKRVKKGKEDRVLKLVVRAYIKELKGKGYKPKVRWLENG